MCAILSGPYEKVLSERKEKAIFRSPGKLLLTGEYAVLEGAVALALPLKYGQSMTIIPTEDVNVLLWEVRVRGSAWFKVLLRLTDFVILSATDELLGNNIKRYMEALRVLKPDFLHGDKGFHVICDIEFAMEWGWGSSATLIVNIARWAGVDAMMFYQLISNGSGYDIACVELEKPVSYQLLNSGYSCDAFSFKPVFRDKIYFVYQGKKVPTDMAVQLIGNKRLTLKSIVQPISEISRAVRGCERLEEFEELMLAHEQIISQWLGQRMIQESFVDFHGILKSLGAWGGDFMMVTWHDSADDFVLCAEKYGWQTWFSWDDIIL